jgi:hypothetical protein
LIETKVLGNNLSNNEVALAVSLGQEFRRTNTLHFTIHNKSHSVTVRHAKVHAEKLIKATD